MLEWFTDTSIEERCGLHMLYWNMLQVKFAASRKELRLGTTPNGATEETIRTNNPSLYHYMRQFSRPSVEAGLSGLKDQYSGSLTNAAIPLYH